MVGSLGSMMGYYFVLFVLIIWMVVKIARDSVPLAVLTFFFWPAAIIPLVRNWGQPGSDIRIPFFMSLLAAGLAVHMANRAVGQAVDEAAIYMSDEDIALVAEQDPALAAQLLAARDAAEAEFDAADGGESGEDEGYSIDLGEYAQGPDAAPADSGPLVLAEDPADSGFSRPASADRVMAPQPAPVVKISDPAALQGEVARLAYRLSSVALEAAHVQLRLPRNFRYAPKFALNRIASLRGTPLEAASLGWVVHQRVSLADPAAWYVEVIFVESGYRPLVAPEYPLAESLAALSGVALGDGSGRLLGSETLAPTWDETRQLLTWSVHDGEQAQVMAAKPLRHGVLLFVMHGLDPTRHELGLRATRLLAAHAEVEAQWAHGDVVPTREALAQASLVDWISAGRGGR